ncbi:TonB-dependent receptor domain-containing protein [Pseudoalteromonas fenneropenaei]|uniref:TonB-dependent receptor domain-containing protein n=1 Tax=Pseudoalteromonas fenneropenaei TaxID=1737459 RepID=A0ABV7CPQ6_9GAMM
MHISTRRSLIASAVISLLTVPVSSALANTLNQSSNNAETADKVEKIAVTGSRIKRDSFSVTTPLAVLDKNAIGDSGLGSLAEILVGEMPQLAEGNSNTNSQSSVQNTGLSTIELRNLGTNRTLTLIDGRRVVSNSYSGNYVSLSTIPTGMVERVEIITGGASAAYGSDAVAGVVNIITQQDKVGTSFKLRGGSSTEGGAEEFSIDADHGSDFADGKGYGFISLTYEEQKELSFYDRKRAQQQQSWAYDETLMCNTMLTEQYDSSRKSNRFCTKDLAQSDWRGLSDSINGGVFDETSSVRPDGGFWYDGQTLRNDWHESKYGINFAQFDLLKVPETSLSIAAKTEYDFDNGMQSYFQLQVSRNKSRNPKSPESEDECDAVITHDPANGEFGEDCIGRIPLDNPYIPAEILAKASSKGVTWDRNFAEVGNIVNSNERTTLRTWAGLRGDMFNDWEWDVSVGHGRFTQEQSRSNEIYVAKVRNALNAEVLADGTVQCKSAAARADGCVPINLFGAGSITAEAADYIRANPGIDTEVTQTTVVGFMSGDLFEMPAGQVASAFGFEYRRDSQSVSTNVPEGGISFNYVPTFKGDVDVYEAFAEASLPLLKDVALVDYLSLDLSARLADYSWSNTGLMSSYKVGLLYQPTEGYMVRANWARAQRAPTITDLLSPPRGDFDSFDDICDGVTATSTGLGHDNCRLEPTIAANIAANGEFKDENNGYSPNVGSPDLKEETADTITLGISLAPEFIPNLQVAIDYFDIRIDDAITSLGNEDIIQFCYASSMPYGADNPFCSDIRRDSEGNIVEVAQRLINTDEITTKGYDVVVDYRYQLATLGELRFKLDWSHVIDFTVTSTGPDGQFSNTYVGLLSSDVFEDKASASVSWSYENWRVRLNSKYKSSIRRSQAAFDDWSDAIAKNAARCAAGEASCVADPEALQFNELSSYMTHSLSVNYTLATEHSGDINLFAGVNNLFDEHGDFIIGGNGGFHSTYGGGKGRYAFIGASWHF